MAPSGQAEHKRPPCRPGGCQIPSLRTPLPTCGPPLRPLVRPACRLRFRWYVVRTPCAKNATREAPAVESCDRNPGSLPFAVLFGRSWHRKPERGGAVSRLQGPLPGPQVRIWRICRFWMSLGGGFRRLKSETLAPLQLGLVFSTAYFVRSRDTDSVKTGRFRTRDRRLETRSGAQTVPGGSGRTRSAHDFPPSGTKLLPIPRGQPRQKRLPRPRNGAEKVSEIV